MKEFEKWSKTPTGYADRDSDYAEGEAAWRAALEYSLSVMKVGDIEMAIDEIEQELRS